MQRLSTSPAIPPHVQIWPPLLCFLLRVHNVPAFPAVLCFYTVLFATASEDLTVIFATRNIWGKTTQHVNIFAFNKLLFKCRFIQEQIDDKSLMSDDRKL